MTMAYGELLKVAGEAPQEYMPFIDRGVVIANALYEQLDTAAQDLNLPSNLYGEHHIQPDRPLSTTGTVLFTGTGLAIKVLNAVDGTGFVPRGNPLYPHEEPFANLTSVLGEAAVGQALNVGQKVNIYLGVAGIALKDTNTVELVPLDTAEVLSGNQQACIVMRKMDQNLLELVLSKRNSPQTREQVTSTAVGIVKKVVEKRVPLPAADAVQKGSYAAIEEMLLRETPGWFLGRNEQELSPYIATCREVNAYFARFLKLSETESQLNKRATSRDQSYTTGDVKLGNMMINKEGDAGIIDPIFLPVKVRGTDTFDLAPWATSDWLQAVAFSMVEPIGYDMPEIAQALKVVAREQSEKEGVKWTPWLELYLDILVGYKVMVETACAANNYLQLLENNDSDSHTMQKIEVYPDKALAYLKAAFATYEMAGAHA